MKAPNVIFANDYGLWYKEKQPGKQTDEYIRKDALLEWAKEKYEEYVKKMKENNYDATRWGQQNAFHQVIEKIESL